MSGIEIYVKDEAEKAKLIEDYLAPDNEYIKALDELKAGLINQGVDLDSQEGKKFFIRKVRELNSRMGATYEEKQKPACDICKSCGD